MLYKYHFIKKHRMHKLNQHFLVFIRKIRFVSTTRSFEPSTFFAPSFLNRQGVIAPNGRENKNLTTKFKSFFDSFKKLNQPLKEEFYKLILFSKDLHLYFEDNNVDVTVLHKSNISRIIGNDSFKELMIALWDSLKTNAWEIDEHYNQFFENQLIKTCTFCGVNQLPNPLSYRSDYDHIAFKGDYPISSINLKNIAPSCSECNQKFKHSKDVFYTDEKLKVRRVFIYPFSNFIDVQIDFSHSVLPNTDITNLKGEWVIKFIPDNDFTKTWDEVFEIKSRYINEVLNVDYKTWLGEFEDELKDYGIKINNSVELKEYLKKHFDRYNKSRLQKRYIVKSSLFRYFYECDNNIFYTQLMKSINKSA